MNETDRTDAERPPPDPGPGRAAILRRYSEVCGDSAAFFDAAEAPLPVVVRANALRGGGQTASGLLPYGDSAWIAGRILARCPEARPVHWMRDAWRLPPDATPGRWPETLLGLLHVQEEAALWAAPLLGARPGERVLDLCAAPGNKTAQLALDMEDRGCLWAIDRSAGRLPGLRRTLERLGVTCAAVACADAATFTPPADALLFDRVLCDVPCTCEGTTRKPDGRRALPGEGSREFLQGIQRRILARGLSLLRPGGTLVYATCTYAPEENEAVLDSVPPEVATIERVDPPPGLVTRPGLTDWEGTRFRSDVIHAHRLWPQDNDTGGFFVARLRRL